MIPPAERDSRRHVVVGSAPPTVAIVVDPEFGERLIELAERMPVWVADTEGNAAAIEQLFRWLRDTGEGSVTSFVVDPRDTRAEWADSVLYTVDEHHGVYSQDPPYRSIEVIGTPLSPALRATCEALGLVSFHDTPAGFTATRSS